jgi:hypothetical protein
MKPEGSSYISESFVWRWTINMYLQMLYETFYKFETLRRCDEVISDIYSLSLSLSLWYLY